MSAGWTSSVLERTAKMLGPRYIICAVEEDSDGGYVAFNDPAMYRADWSGPIYGGIVRYSKAELLRLESDPGSNSHIRKRVEEAKNALLQQISEYKFQESALVRGHALKLSSILCATLLLSQIF